MAKNNEETQRSWKRFDRDESAVMAILASEMADPGSTGCGLDWEFELPENPRETDE